MDKPKFFATQKKGENHELQESLNSEYPHLRSQAVKKVIQSMTLGKDVSSLFPSVVKNMQTEDLELKKLIYLYLINYAKSQPELVILCVNTFVKDSDDFNPLIRALALRTMGCLRSEKIVGYLMEPLKKGLVDKDPYVRKTAALCVAKLFALNPQTAIETGLISILQDMLSDPNPMVIANTVAALSEISEQALQRDIFVIGELVLQKLMAAMNECTEWGQICILSAFATYAPKNVKDAEIVIERVLSRLQHVNAAIVLEAVRVMTVYLSRHYSDDLDTLIIKKLGPPLVTLLSNEPEIQFVALRNISLVLEASPRILKDEVRVFFTKYNDPLYVKLEKLEILTKLASIENVDQVISELKEYRYLTRYANEVDLEFVKKSIRAIGVCAIKIPESADQCIATLLEIYKTGIPHILQEAIIVMRDIFRKYPARYTSHIPVLCENLDLDNQEARASLVWIVGEYASSITNAGELVTHFLEDFRDAGVKVQLQLLSAAVKLFLVKPEEAKDLVQKVLADATSNENPDVRDRAYIYWRLLSANPAAAKTVVMSEKPPIELESLRLPKSLLDELVPVIGSLASVFHTSPTLFGGCANVDMTGYREADDDTEERKLAVRAAVKELGPMVENLLDFDFEITSTPLSVKSQMSDLMSDEPPPMVDRKILLKPEISDGLELAGAFVDNHSFMDLLITNKSSVLMSDFAIQFNVNPYQHGISPVSGLAVPSLSPGAYFQTKLGLKIGEKVGSGNDIQIAFKNNIGVYYFQTGF